MNAVPNHLHELRLPGFLGLSLHVSWYSISSDLHTGHVSVICRQDVGSDTASVIVLVLIINLFTWLASFRK